MGSKYSYIQECSRESTQQHTQSIYCIHVAHDLRHEGVFLSG